MQLNMGPTTGKDSNSQIGTQDRVQQIMTLLTYNNASSDPIEVLIQENCEAFRLETGWTGNRFAIPEECKPVITESWIKRYGKNVKN